MEYGAGKHRYVLVDNWARLPEGWAFVDVCGIAVDESNNVYVLSRGNHAVMVFNRDGNLIRSWGDGLFKRAHGCCVARNGRVWCTDDGDHFVAEFESDGNLVAVLGQKGTASDTGYKQTRDLWESLATISRAGPPFNRPTGVALDEKGDVYVTDGYGNSRVHRFSRSGELIKSWGTPGGKLGQFRLPHDIAIDGSGRLYVADRENHRIQVFDRDGRPVGLLDNVIRPTGICIDQHGDIYVCELARRISIFDSSGHLLTRWGNPPGAGNELLHAPHTIAVDAEGSIYIGEVAMGYAGVEKGVNAIRKFLRA
jgi:DNA-binding beta-propeller fold protein YncE